MAILATWKMTRTSTDVDWNRSTEDQNAMKAHIQSTYYETGKLLTTNTFTSADQLTRTVRRVFKNQVAWEEFKSDPELKKYVLTVEGLTVNRTSAVI